MIVLGVVLAVVFGWFFPIPLVFDLGVLLVVIGVVLVVLGAVGRPVGGRTYYW